jgi:hypothetical protein
MPVTCGSIGDIIAIGLLVKDLVTVLNQSRGSQAEYKQLVDELNLLHDVLTRIGNLCSTTTTAGRRLEVSALHNTALQVAHSCRKCIEGFTNTRLNKYVKTLGSSGAREKSEAFKAAMAKIRWQLGEKEEVARFRAEIAGQKTLLDLVLSAITLYGCNAERFHMKNHADSTQECWQGQPRHLGENWRCHWGPTSGATRIFD